MLVLISFREPIPKNLSRTEFIQVLRVEYTVQLYWKTIVQPYARNADGM